MTAQVRLRIRLMNQRKLQMSDDAGAVKELETRGGKVLPSAAAASCSDICLKSVTVRSPESGLSVL
jgi:hypothetical protein